MAVSRWACKNSSQQNRNTMVLRAPWDDCMYAHRGVSVCWWQTALSLCSTSPCMLNLCPAGMPERYLQKKVSELFHPTSRETCFTLLLGETVLLQLIFNDCCLCCQIAQALLLPHEHQLHRHLTYTKAQLPDCAPSTTLRFQSLPGLLHSTTISSRRNKDYLI